MGINQNTIYSWKKRDEWDTTPPIQRVTTSIDARLIQLTSKNTKTGGDFKEIDLLTRQLKKLDNGTPATQPKKKIRKKQNFFSEAQIPRCGPTLSTHCTGIRKPGMRTITTATGPF